MRVIILSLISIILLSGCTAKVAGTEPSQTPAQIEQQAEITEGTTVEITKASESTGSKTYQVNVVQGIGVREGPG